MSRTLIACAATVWLASSFACKPVSSTSPPAPVERTASDPLSIEPNDELRKRLTIGRVPSATVGDTITVAARIEVDENRMTRIGAPVMGRITSLHAQVGQHVDEGQTLAVLSSTLVSDQQLAFLKALTQGQVALRAVERARLLLKSEVIGVAELQRREAELEEAVAARDVSRDQLMLLGISSTAIDKLEKERKIDSSTRIVASMRGTVLERKVTPGQVIQPADSVFEIADLSSVWLVADVPSPEATNLYIGQRVEASVGSPPLAKVHGTLSYVSSTVDAETRTLRVRMQVPNPSGRLRPSMLATMSLQGRTETRPCMPFGGLVRESDKDHLFVSTASGSLQLAPVELGAEHDHCRVLLSGIGPDKLVVLDGAFHLNNERRRQSSRSGGE